VVPRLLEDWKATHMQRFGLGFERMVQFVTGIGQYRGRHRPSEDAGEMQNSN